MSGKENLVPLKFKNLEDLRPQYDRLQLTGKDPRTLMQKLDLIFKAAEGKLKSGDQEGAYILIMKYLSVFTFIQKTDDYQKDPRYYKAMIGKQPARAIELAEKIQQMLAERYKEQQSLDNHIRNPNDTLKTEKSKVEAETPDMRVKRESKSALSSANLFNMLKDGTTKVLIMDARTSSDFKSSRINDSSILNVPEEIILRGKSAHSLEQQLTDMSKELWKLKNSYDQIVLIDWDTNELAFDESKLSILKDILTKWDANANYKNDILILDGGYDDWLNSYPWFTTNPKPLRQIVEEIPSDGTLDQVIYPDLDDLNANVEQEYLKPFFDRSTKPLKRSLYDIEYEGDENMPSLPGKPSIDRAKKAAAIRTYEERKADMENLLTQKVLENSAVIELEKSMLDNERELRETIRMQKEMEADEEQKRILEEQEEKLLMKVEELKEESLIKDNKIKELQKIIEIYEKKDTEEMAKKEEDEDRQLREAEMNEQIKIQEKEKERLAREREEMEKAQDLERKSLEEKYREKLQIARLAKKRQMENELTSFNTHMQTSESVDRIPTINRTNKPRYEEKIRHFSGVKGKVGRGLTGLKNLGNTCYMNSIIQCVSNNSALAKYFCGNHYRDDINRLNKTRGEIAEELAAVVKALWSGHYRSIACRDLKNTIGLHKPEYAGYEQQDSHEFLTFLMDWLHSDLNKVRSVTPADDNNITNEMDKAWRNFKRKNESLISTLFYGLQKSTVKCLKCDEESVTYEPFSNLSLIIPEMEYNSLEQCLRLYLKSERISGWRCPKCREHREAEKKTDICRLPPILVIHLKRFHYVEVLSRKRTTHVDFPLTDLNMASYTVNQKQRHSNYNLCGVSNHYGTMEGGHYTAFCKNVMFKKWYKFDDHEVFEMSHSEVKTSAAYILFYSSINYQVPDPLS